MGCAPEVEEGMGMPKWDRWLWGLATPWNESEDEWWSWTGSWHDKHGCMTLFISYISTQGHIPGPETQKQTQTQAPTSPQTQDHDFVDENDG